VTTYTFSPLQEVTMSCACGHITGKVELTEWGIAIHFECDECESRVTMEVKG